jgi:hypothetical protein
MDELDNAPASSPGLAPGSPPARVRERSVTVASFSCSATSRPQNRHARGELFRLRAGEQRSTLRNNCPHCLSRHGARPFGGSPGTLATAGRSPFTVPGGYHGYARPAHIRARSQARHGNRALSRSCSQDPSFPIANHRDCRHRSPIGYSPLPEDSGTGHVPAGFTIMRQYHLHCIG